MEKSNHRSFAKRHQKGFAVVLFTAVMLVLSGALLGWGTTLYAVNKKNHIQKECVQLTLGAQTFAEGKINQLLRLNPTAKALSNRNKVLKLRLAAAIARGDAATILLTEAQLVALFRQRTALEQMQNLLITSVEDSQLKWIRLSRSQLKSAVSKTYNSPPLEILGDRPAPQYRVPKTLEAKTAMVASGILQLNFIQPLKVPWACEGRLRLKHEKVIAVLSETT